MHRFSKNLALLACAAAVAACSGQSKTSSGDGSGQQGQFGSFYVVTVNKTPGGKVTSTDGRIDCGTVSGVTTNACSAQYTWGVDAILSAVADPSNLNAAGLPDPFIFQSWAGDCMGAVAVNGCVVGTNGDNKADKTVVAVFNVAGQLGHTRIPEGSVHGPMYVAFATNQPTALECTRCHGDRLQGLANAPSCSTCHFAPQFPPAAVTGPEYCGACHTPSTVASVHAITGKVATTVTAPVSGSGNLTFTVNVKVDGVNKTGLVLPPPSGTPPTQTAAYRYAQRAASVGVATVIVPNERISLTTPSQATVVDAGAGNYTVTIIGGAALTGNQTFLVRLQDAVVSPTMVYATAVTHLNAPVRDLVGDATCVACHDDQVFRHREGPADNFAFHHGANPYGVSACIVCHSVYGSTSRSMGGDRLTAYVHGVHNSHNMPARNVVNTIDPDGRNGPLAPIGPFTVAKPDGVYARNDSLSFVGAPPYDLSSPAQIASPFSVGFPGYLVNCSICHDTTARQAAIMTFPVSASTCFSCHDSMIGFPTFVVGTPEYNAKLAENSNWYPNVVAPHLAMPQPAAGTAAANACATCHNTTGGGARATVGDYHITRITERNGVVYKGVDLSISQGDRVTMSIDSVSYADTTTLLVTWTARLDGVAVNPCNSNIATGPVFMNAAAVPATGQSASNMSLLQAYAQGNDWVNSGVVGSSSPGQPITAPTLSMSVAATASGRTDCSANIATSRIPAPATPVSATKGVVGLQGKPQITFTDGSFTRVIQLRSTSPVKEFVAGTGAVPSTPRRAIVSNDKCLACHPGSLYQHGGNRVDSVDLCVMCHNPAANEKNNRVGLGVDASEAYDGKPGQTYDLRTMVHAIHSAGATNAALVYYRSNGIYIFGSQAAIDAAPNWPGTGTQTIFGSSPAVTRTHNEIVIHYPRALNACTACHLPGTENGFGDQTQRMAVTMYDAGAAPWNNLNDDVLMGAGAASCMTCHQSGDAAVQAQLRGHANTYGFEPQAFPEGRKDIIDFATCGFFTCP